MRIETYFSTTTSKGETVLHACCDNRETEKLKNLVVDLLSYPDRQKSLDFLLQKNCAGETAFHIVRPTKDDKGMYVWAPGTKEIWNVLKRAYDCLSPPPSKLEASHAESVPSIFSCLQRRQYHLLARECVSGKGNDIYQRKTPLTFCIGNEDLHGLKVLLSTPGVDTNRRDGFGLTPLIAAIMEENPQAIKILLEHGVDREAPDTIDLKPIEYARGLGNQEILKLLSEPQAQVPISSS
jgi:hypothetical protein